MIHPIKVLIIGSDGMLGNSLQENLASDLSFEIFCTTRRTTTNKISFDPIVDSVDKLIEITRPKYIINCLRSTRNPNSNYVDKTLDQYRINVKFQKNLMRSSYNFNSFVIQIGTDGVFNGRKGLYSEESAKNSYSAYGRTKIIGEKYSNNALFLRTSIIGIDKRTKNFSLLSWVLAHEKNADVYGYMNHYWNGVTTSVFADIAAGLMKRNYLEPGFRHLVPSNSLSKFELITEISKVFGRSDLNIIPSFGRRRIDRRLITMHPEWNENAWLSAGYGKILAIDEMLKNLASSESKW
jgi:dTDP-4-dehydrorhamnose reductase